MPNKNDDVRFFLPMIPPRITKQQSRVTQSKSGKMIFYETPELKSAHDKFLAHLGHKFNAYEKQCGIEKPMFANVPVRLMVKWLFPLDRTNKHNDGDYKITRPDTDNLQKLFKDCLTEVGFFSDDAIVASEIVEKFWSDTPGIFVAIQRLDI